MHGRRRLSAKPVPSFVAIDFETASYTRDSACAVGLVRMAAGKVTDSQAFLIRPPSPQFVFTYLHGITWDMVKDAPTFAELLPKLNAFIGGAQFVAAHNASFDRGVFTRACEHYGLEVPGHRYVCTVTVARGVWSIFPTKLPDVCARLGIDPGRHHDAADDALACARIVDRALDELGPASFARRYL